MRIAGAKCDGDADAAGNGSGNRNGDADVLTGRGIADPGDDVSNDGAASGG